MSRGIVRALTLPLLALSPLAALVTGPTNTDGEIVASVRFVSISVRRAVADLRDVTTEGGLVGRRQHR